ncbi:AAA family ATPase [Candidatus Acetothermia bacterium]|nr:AAA family ATPase [Candidatus Acetothermia bacterium]MBI3643322.1 AAA family ATPase [Candidatus Acetothermia bacterium]
MIHKLTPKELRRIYDSTGFGCETTADVKPLREIIGQERASRALRFGLEIESVGFNMYVSGPPGIGKMTAVEAFLEDMAKQKDHAEDWCYVHNFDDPYQPTMIRLPAGMGTELQQDMKRLIENIRREVPQAFESEEYNSKREEILKALNQGREGLFEKLQVRATQAGFALQPTPAGVLVVPVKENKPLTDEEFQALPEQERERLKKGRDELQSELNTTLKQLRVIEKSFQQQLKELDQLVALYLVGSSIHELLDKYEKMPEVVAFLQAAQNQILENIDSFRPAQPQQDGQGQPPDQPPWVRELPFRKYHVNLLVDHGELPGAPVVLEHNPTYNNLFGRIEKETQFGTLYTDHTMIRAGSIHRANGGYLVMPILDVLQNLMTWESLKRALKSGEVQIEEISERMGYAATKSLRPEPIPLDVKVVLVGRPDLYYSLHSNDEEFPELFKVKADFDTRMESNQENILKYTSFLCSLCQKERLQHLDSSAIAKTLEYAARLAEDQEKLSTAFGPVADLVREASFWARESKSKYIEASHIGKALGEKVYRANLVEKRIQEMIAEKTLLIDTEGARVGQINGLAVLSLGDYAFGKPSRITVSISPGRDGVLDIEREVQMGGKIHSKGVMILTGYLREKFAQDKPLSLSARLVFEQSYEGVDGDSASSTELYAILSALSGKPIKQSFAVTGSVNQHGEVQAIGGVNHKIEGFFDICKAKGLTGEQGVMIPASNMKSLMLREDVIEAVRKKKFQIWSVSTIDEGIEVLTGVAAGKRGKDGKFPKGSVNGLVNERLLKLNELMQGMNNNKKKTKKKKSK